MAVPTQTFYSRDAALLNDAAVTNLTQSLEDLWGQGAVVWRTILLADFVASGKGNILEITLDNTVRLRDLNITVKRRNNTDNDNIVPNPVGGVFPLIMPIPFNSFDNATNKKYIFRIKREHLNSFNSALSFSLCKVNNKLSLIVKFSPIVFQMQVGNNIYNAVSLGSGGVKIPR